MLVKTFSIDQFVNDANDAILDALNDLMILEMCEIFYQIEKY